MTTKKTLIVRTSSAQDVSEYSDEYIEAMQTIMRGQAKSMEGIIDIAFEVRREDDPDTTHIDEARAQRLLRLVRNEFRVADAGQEGEAGDNEPA